jgi:hypothetical protein
MSIIAKAIELAFATATEYFIEALFDITSRERSGNPGAAPRRAHVFQKCPCGRGNTKTAYERPIGI